jgi:hypothetical protein
MVWAISPSFRRKEEHRLHCARVLIAFINKQAEIICLAEGGEIKLLLPHCGIMPCGMQSVWTGTICLLEVTLTARSVDLQRFWATLPPNEMNELVRVWQMHIAKPQRAFQADMRFPSLGELIIGCLLLYCKKKRPHLHGIAFLALAQFVGLLGRHIGRIANGSKTDMDGHGKGMRVDRVWDAMEPKRKVTPRNAQDRKFSHNTPQVCRLGRRPIAKNPPRHPIASYRDMWTMSEGSALLARVSWY